MRRLAKEEGVSAVQNAMNRFGRKSCASRPDYDKITASDCSCGIGYYESLFLEVRTFVLSGVRTEAVQKLSMFYYGR